MVSCGVTFNNAGTLATEIFMDDYVSCMDLSEKDLADSFKTLSNLIFDNLRIKKIKTTSGIQNYRTDKRKLYYTTVPSPLSVIFKTLTIFTNVCPYKGNGRVDTY